MSAGEDNLMNRMCSQFGSRIQPTRASRFRRCCVTIHQARDRSFLQTMRCGQKLSRLVPYSNSADRHLRHDRTNMRTSSRGTPRSRYTTVSRRSQNVP